MEHAISVNNIEDITALINKRNIKHIKIGITDLNGILRGKYISQEKFIKGLEHGLGFCDVIVGSDIDDQLIDGMKATGWQTGYPDANIRIIPESGRQIPFEPNSLFFLCEFVSPNDVLCPRSILQRVLDRAESHGLYFKSAFEFEFTVFDETPESVREKHYQHLTPLSPGNFGYSVLRNTVLSDLYDELLQTCIDMNMDLECLHTEIGPGVLEAAIGVDQAMFSADKAAIFKTMTKIIVQRSGLMASFMARLSQDCQGQSGHIHISANDKEGRSTFFDANSEHHMSPLMQQFVAGQQALMPELLAMVAPTVNSYTRLVPGYWAPTASNWGVDNRTASLRVITGSASAQRVEYRISAADCNPYLALAAAIGSGLWGIEQQLELGKPVEGNAYEQSVNKSAALPQTLMDAARRLRASKPARELFADAFIDDYATTREWEDKQSRKQITDWQLQRYFELA